RCRIAVRRNGASRGSRERDRASGVATVAARADVTEHPAHRAPAIPVGRSGRTAQRPARWLAGSRLGGRSDRRHRHNDERRTPARARNSPLGLRFEPEYALALMTGDGSMQEMAIHEAGKHPRTSRAGCCPDDECGICGGSLKNNYYAGKRLTPDTFRVEQRYHVERRRLLNRAIHGWGVVYGYPITAHTRDMRKSSTRERPRRDPCDRRDDEPRDTRDGVTRPLKIQDGLARDPRNGVTRRLKIEDGLALDTCGRELLQVVCTMVALDDVLVVDDRGRRL